MRPTDLHERLHYYDRAEEIVNRLTHGLGALLSVIGVIALVGLAARQGEPNRFIASCIYGGAMIIFYSLSTAYHSVSKPYPRYILRILEHASIYLMIAGSCTPFALVALQGAWRWWILGTVWGLGAVGAILKVFTIHRLRVVGPLLYLGLGWLVVVAIKPLSMALGTDGLTLLFGGGMAYTVGVLFYLWDRLPFNHAIWHLFVLAGSACHFAAIFLYVTPLHSLHS